MEFDLIRSAALQNWLGAAGVYAYLGFILGQRMQSGLERRMILVLACLGGLFLARGFDVLLGYRWLRVLTFAHATVLPLAATLLTEGLLRRHVPLLLKLFVAAGTATFFAWNVLALGDMSILIGGFGAFVVLVFGWLFVILVTRDRSQLSPGENQLIGSLAVAFATGILAASTDFRLRPASLPVGLGAVGGLVFVYSCVRLSQASDSGWRVARDVLSRIAQALVVATGAGFLLHGATFGVHAANAALALAAVLLLAVLSRLNALRRGGRARAFLRALLRADTGSLEAFIRDLDGMPLAEQHVVLRGRGLESYDAARLSAAFEGEHPEWALSEVRAALDRGSIEREAGEQIVDALVTHGMTHATLLCAEPTVLLLLNLPELAGENDSREEVALLGKLGRVITDAEPRRA